MQNQLIKQLKILSMTVATLIVLQGCSTSLQPKLTYRIDKIPDVQVRVNGYGGLYKKEKEKAFNLIVRLRYIEEYYYQNSTKMKDKGFIWNILND